MTDEIEGLFQQVAPRGAPPALREQVLAAVTREVMVARSPTWETRVAWLAAAAVLIGVGMNWWVVKSSEARLAALAGPRPVPRQISEMVEIVETVTGDGTGGWVEQRLARKEQHPSSPAMRVFSAGPDWIQQLEELDLTRKGSVREKDLEIPQKRPDRAGRAARHLFDCVCDFSQPGRRPPRTQDC